MLNERVGIDVKLQIEGLCSLNLSLEKSLAERVNRSFRGVMQQKQDGRG